MIWRTPRSTRTDKLLPYTTLCRSCSPTVRAGSRSVTPATLASALTRRTAADCLGSLNSPTDAVPSDAFIRPVSASSRLVRPDPDGRSEEHTSELQSLMRISYAVFCLKKKKQHSKPYKY